MPFAALVGAQALPVQAMAAHAVALGVQSLVCTQATHFPLPSQTLPPLSMQLAPIVALAAPQQPFSQGLVMHWVECAGQLASEVQAWLPVHTGGEPPVLPVLVAPPVPPVMPL
jgi:hypothetical protein